MMNKKFWHPASTLALAAICAALVVPFSGSAQQIEIFTEDLSTFNLNTDFGDPPFDFGMIATNVTPGVCSFGSGNALHMFDFSMVDKPEGSAELSQPIMGPFQISFQSCNQSMSTNPGPAIRFRMSNSGKTISGNARSAFSLSWHADLTFSATYDSTPGDYPTVSTAPQAPGVHDVLLVGNHSTTSTYTYTLFGATRTLDTIAYDIYIDGELLNTNFVGGLKFNATSAADYDPSLGLVRFGMTGSGNSEFDPDVWYDNIILNIGDVPTQAAITQVNQGTAEGFSFTSSNGVVYVLQSSTNAMDAIPVWVETGLEVTGNGSDQILFDPAGYDTNKTYRIIEAQ